MAPFFQRLVDRLRFGEPVIVVSGLPRSGTSMSMKMLEAGGVPVVQDGIRSADEDNPKGYFEHERVKELDKGGDTSWVKNSRGRAIKVISYLLPHLPDGNRYKVLFMHRKYEEVLASQAKMLDRRGEKSGTSDERMIEIYEKHLAEMMSSLARRPSFELLEMRYHEVLADPLSHARRIDEFLELGLNVDAMAGVVDPDLYRNRATAGASS